MEKRIFDLSAEQCRLLKAHASALKAETAKADHSGCLDLVLTLTPWSVTAVNAE